jgi:hypothetical protein
MLTSCITPARSLKTEVVRSKKGAIKEVYTYYLDPNQRRVRHGDYYVYSGEGAGFRGMGRGIRRVYKDGVVVKEAEFVFHP